MTKAVRGAAQVRGAATWAGNLAFAAHNPSFPSDMLTVLWGVGGSLTLLKGGEVVTGVDVGTCVARIGICIVVWTSHWGMHFSYARSRPAWMWARARVRTVGCALSVWLSRTRHIMQSAMRHVTDRRYYSSYDVDDGSVVILSVLIPALWSQASVLPRLPNAFRGSVVLCSGVRRMRTMTSAMLCACVRRMHSVTSLGFRRRRPRQVRRRGPR